MLVALSSVCVCVCGRGAHVCLAEFGLNFSTFFFLSNILKQAQRFTACLFVPGSCPQTHADGEQTELD